VTVDLALPARMANLPKDKHGRPIPWFVAIIDDVPDFRVIRRGGIVEAMRFKRCWVCGQPLGVNAAFVLGPMCAVNRTSAEPPSHRDCAIYSAQACPFLANPGMKRRERHLPDDRVEPAGVMITRNPGVALVWVTRRWSVFPDQNGRPLFDIGKPEQTYWYAEGRDATRAEVLASIESGLPLLRDEAKKEGAYALVVLEAQTEAALKVVPAEVPPRG
jgi:hypothetical protein